MVRGVRDARVAVVVAHGASAGALERERPDAANEASDGPGGGGLGGPEDAVADRLAVGRERHVVDDDLAACSVTEAREFVEAGDDEHFCSKSPW